MLCDSTSTLIDGLVSSSSSVSSQFPPQSSSFNRKRVTPQVNTPTPKRKMWEYLRFIIRPVPAMLTVLLRSEPVSFDTILSICSWDMTRKTHQHVTSDHWKCTKKKHIKIRKCEITSRSRYKQYRSQKGGRIQRASVGNSNAPVSACDTLVSTSNCTRTQGKVC